MSTTEIIFIFSCQVFWFCKLTTTKPCPHNCALVKISTKRSKWGCTFVTIPTFYHVNSAFSSTSWTTFLSVIGAVMQWMGYIVGGQNLQWSWITILADYASSKKIVLQTFFHWTSRHTLIQICLATKKCIWTFLWYIGFSWHWRKKFEHKIRPDTRQSNRGPLGWSSSAKTTRNSKMLRHRPMKIQHRLA